MIYGLVVYLGAMAALAYTVLFLWDVGLALTIDGGQPVTPVGSPRLVNVILLGIFALQHSVMARRSFKRWWLQYIPPEVERPTYVLATSIALVLIFAFWHPMPAEVWHVEMPELRTALYVVSALGFVIVVIASFQLDHADLFGLRTPWQYLRGRKIEHSGFRTPGLYSFVRHPIQLGLLIAFWSAPTMTQGHLLFSVVCTIYIFVALRLEEETLVAEFGDTYRRYQQQVHMILPLRRYRG